MAERWLIGNVACKSEDVIGTLLMNNVIFLDSKKLIDKTHTVGNFIL